MALGRSFSPQRIKLAADLFLQYRKVPSLTWGGPIDLNSEGPDRREYLASLRDADGGGYDRLIRFAKPTGHIKRRILSSAMQIILINH